MRRGKFFTEILGRLEAIGYTPNYIFGNSTPPHDNSKNTGAQAIRGVCHYKFFLRGNNIRLVVSFSTKGSGHQYGILESQQEAVERDFRGRLNWEGLGETRSQVNFLGFGEMPFDIEQERECEATIDWMVERVQRMNRVLQRFLVSQSQ